MLSGSLSVRPLSADTANRPTHRPLSADAANGPAQRAQACHDSTNCFARSYERAQNNVQKPSNRARSAGTRGGPRVAVQAAQAASGETSTFLEFVDLLASKTPAEAQSILALAAQAAHRGPGSLARGLTKPPTSPYVSGGTSMRRSSSAEEIHRASRRSASLGQQRRSPVRSRSAGAGLLTAAQLLLDADADQFQASHPPPQQQQALAEATHALRARMYWDAAATFLQAAWRGRMHRRICRFLRARGSRHRRLQWLADRDEVGMFIRWVEAATCVQAAIRAKTGRRAPPPRKARAERRGPQPQRSRQVLSWRDLAVEGEGLCDVQFYDVDAGEMAWPEPTLYG